MSLLSHPAGADASGEMPHRDGRLPFSGTRLGGKGAPRDQTHGLGWALVAPAVVVLLAMTIFPAIYLLWASFRRFNLMMPENAAFIGLANYQNIFVNDDIRHSMVITILFVVAAVGIEFVLGLLLALTLAPKRRSNTVAATLAHPAHGRHAGGFRSRLA